MTAAESDGQPLSQRYRMLAVSLLAWTICMAVWTMFSIVGVRIQQELGLTETQLGILLATPVLTGSVSRPILGIWAETLSPRPLFTGTMLVSAASCWLLSYAPNYPLVLVGALGLGLAGGTFILGVTFNARWFPKKEQGTALGIFAAGNVGAAITNFGAPLLISGLGWTGVAQVYAVVMAVTAVVFQLVSRNDPETLRRRQGEAGGATLKDQLAPLRFVQVWRFGLYYFFVFGGFVALASWLPRYYVGVYGLPLEAAGTLTALFSLSAGGFRALGGYVADRNGPRWVMYVTFIASLVCLFILSYPPTTYQIEAVDGSLIEFTLVTNVVIFTILLFIMGFFMGIGMAAVYKHIPNYYPKTVGSVGGMVGMIGGLGGFFMPPVFGALNDITNIWTTPFMAMFLLVAINLTWMHFAVVRMNQRMYPELAEQRDLPEGVPPEQRAQREPGYAPQTVPLPTEEGGQQKR